MTGPGSAARERILLRIRRANEGAPPPSTVDAPQPPCERFVEAPGRPLLGALAASLEAAGAEAAVCSSLDSLHRRLADLAGGDGVAVGATVPPAYLPPALAGGDGTDEGEGAPLPPPPTSADAGLGISVAVAAAAECGSLLLDARDGRRVQLLPPVHAVIVRAADVHPTLADALAARRDDLPSALALHSGPSKSADIGQILVRGVHGPGRLVALILEDGDG